MTDEPDSQRMQVVINDEEQYSIWPADRDLPRGWHPTGVAGTKEECLTHIDTVWTDIRPRSLREHMAQAASAASQFDQLGTVYDTFSDSPFRRYLELPTVFSFLGDIAGLDVLDIGCGSGVYTRLLKRRGARRAVGLDLMPGMVEHAREIEEAAPVGAEYLAGGLPSKLNGTFDVVLAVYVLPYATDSAQLADLCRTAARALRPGGRLVTLPVNPEVRRDRKYYEPYGFRMYGSATGADPDPITLDLCYEEIDETISAWVWSAQAIESALSEAGFTDITWSGPIVEDSGRQAMGQAFWQPYLDCPHALTVQCHLPTVSPRS
ncbi:MbtH family NRPS accessory protein [Saccharopolyspora sp. NPDC003752]